MMEFIKMFMVILLVCFAFSVAIPDNARELCMNNGPILYCRKGHVRYMNSKSRPYRLITKIELGPSARIAIDGGLFPKLDKIRGSLATCDSIVGEHETIHVNEETCAKTTVTDQVDKLTTRLRSTTPASKSTSWSTKTTVTDQVDKQTTRLRSTTPASKSTSWSTKTVTDQVDKLTTDTASRPTRTLTRKASSLDPAFPNLASRQTLRTSTNRTLTSKLRGLPAPKSAVDTEVGEDDLEEEVKPKAAQLSDAPKPPPKRPKQPVKISIPKLQATNESDEDEEPVTKKAKPAPAQQGKSGLFALLPAPVHVAKKETNRLLIPHTLTKRPQAKKPVQKPTKPKLESQTAESAESGFSKRYTAFSGLTGYDSDSDEETTTSNFFSLDSEQGQNTSNPVKSNPDVSDPVSQSVTVPSSGDAPDVSSTSSTPASSVVTVEADDDSVLPAVVSHIPPTEPESDSPVLDQDAPLCFKPTVAQHNPLSAVSVSARYQYYQSRTSRSSEPQSYEPYPQYADYEDQPAPDEDISQYMQDEQFLRLQGKNKRGKEEINIIDANMDDFVNPVDIAKNLTEESSYQSHRKKDNNPTTQQRRKKQITYLAFQAKERELELKNSWAQSRMTKRQTQAKYGF